MQNLKRLSELDGKEQYGFETLNKFAALEDLDVWTLRWILTLSGKRMEGITKFEKKIQGYSGLQKHKSLRDRGC
jgi:fructosamine-3-kinase